MGVFYGLQPGILANYLLAARDILVASPRVSIQIVGETSQSEVTN
jgi:hypothetical protein